MGHAKFWGEAFLIFLSPLSASALWLLIAAASSTVLFVSTGQGVTRAEFVFLFLTFVDVYATYLLIWVPFAWFLMCGGSVTKWLIQRRLLGREARLFPDWPLLCVGGLLCLPIAYVSSTLPLEGDGLVTLLTAAAVVLCFTTSAIYCGLKSGGAVVEKAAR